MQPSLEALLAEQHQDGAFRSVVDIHGKRLEDRNAFVTALVLRALRRLPAHTQGWLATRYRALDFLQRCEASGRPCVYGFWPADEIPAWIDTQLPPDADDTTIVGVLMLESGRKSRLDLLQCACKTLVSYRLRQIRPSAVPWLRAGAFLTWLDGDGTRNAVDCVVNTNVVGYLAAIGETTFPGYAEACQVVESGLLWAGDSLKRARRLTPFYPHPSELLWAVRHAVAQGARALVPALDILKRLPWAECNIVDPLRPVCGNAYGGISWTAPCVHMARQIAALVDYGTPEQGARF